MNAPLVGSRKEMAPTTGPDLFRTVSSHWPSGVAVITCASQDGSFHGLTMNAVIALSVDPMQFLISLDKKSNTLPVLAATGRFCINFLARGQQDVCGLFASKMPDKFASVPHRVSALGLPLLEGAVSHISCDVANIVSSGDHQIVIGDVLDMEHFGGEPLLYFKRAFHDTVASS